MSDDDVSGESSDGQEVQARAVPVESNETTLRLAVRRWRDTGSPSQLIVNLGLLIEALDLWARKKHKKVPDVVIADLHLPWTGVLVPIGDVQAYLTLLTRLDVYKDGGLPLDTLRRKDFKERNTAKAQVGAARLLVALVAKPKPLPTLKPRVGSVVYPVAQVPFSHDIRERAFQLLDLRLLLGSISDRMIGAVRGLITPDQIDAVNARLQAIDATPDYQMRMGRPGRAAEYAPVLRDLLRFVDEAMGVVLRNSHAAYIASRPTLLAHVKREALTKFAYRFVAGVFHISVAGDTALEKSDPSHNMTDVDIETCSILAVFYDLSRILPGKKSIDDVTFSMSMDGAYPLRKGNRSDDTLGDFKPTCNQNFRRFALCMRRHTVVASNFRSWTGKTESDVLYTAAEIAAIDAAKRNVHAVQNIIASKYGAVTKGQVLCFLAVLDRFWSNTLPLDRPELEGMIVRSGRRDLRVDSGRVGGLTSYASAAVTAIQAALDHPIPSINTALKHDLLQQEELRRRNIGRPVVAIAAPVIRERGTRLGIVGPPEEIPIQCNCAAFGEVCHCRYLGDSSYDRLQEPEAARAEVQQMRVVPVAATLPRIVPPPVVVSKDELRRIAALQQQAADAALAHTVARDAKRTRLQHESVGGARLRARSLITELAARQPRGVYRTHNDVVTELFRLGMDPVGLQDVEVRRVLSHLTVRPLTYDPDDAYERSRHVVCERSDGPVLPADRLDELPPSEDEYIPNAVDCALGGADTDSSSSTSSSSAASYVVVDEQTRVIQGDAFLEDILAGRDPPGAVAGFSALYPDKDDQELSEILGKRFLSIVLWHVEHDEDSDNAVARLFYLNPNMPLHVTTEVMGLVTAAIQRRSTSSRDTSLAGKRPRERAIPVVVAQPRAPLCNFYYGNVPPPRASSVSSDIIDAPVFVSQPRAPLCKFHFHGMAPPTRSLRAPSASSDSSSSDSSHFSRDMQIAMRRGRDNTRTRDMRRRLQELAERNARERSSSPLRADIQYEDYAEESPKVQKAHRSRYHRRGDRIELRPAPGPDDSSDSSASSDSSGLGVPVQAAMGYAPGDRNGMSTLRIVRRH